MITELFFYEAIGMTHILPINPYFYEHWCLTLNVVQKIVVLVNLLYNYNSKLYFEYFIVNLIHYTEHNLVTFWDTLAPFLKLFITCDKFIIHVLFLHALKICCQFAKCYLMPSNKYFFTCQNLTFYGSANYLIVSVISLK